MSQNLLLFNCRPIYTYKSECLKQCSKFNAARGNVAILNRVARLNYEKTVFWQWIARSNREERQTKRPDNKNPGQGLVAQLVLSKRMVLNGLIIKHMECWRWGVMMFKFLFLYACLFRASQVKSVYCRGMQ